LSNRMSGEEATSDIDDDETRQLVKIQNRKNKKSGGFQSMGLSHGIFKGIFRRGYKIPTPIQRKCIPRILDGKDVLAMARTGSGKTAAFLIPILERLKTREHQGPRAVILSPTRELALQTAKFTTELSKFTNLHVSVILGGDTMDSQFAQIDEQPDIVIATPGRLLHILVEMDRKLPHVKMAVFDEADQLFEMGFAEQLNEILGRLPESKQVLLFSATLPNKILEFAKAGLRDPDLIRLDVEKRLPENLKMTFFHSRHEDKLPALLHLLSNVIATDQKVVIFVATKHHVELLRQVLMRHNYDPCYIYSSLDPLARKMMIQRFRHESDDPTKVTNLMIVTDIAARGIDIPLLDAVINYNFPPKAKLFIHRVGRVARAGRAGIAYSIVSNEEMPYLLDLYVFLGRKLSYCQDGDPEWDGRIGRYPQSAIDTEAETVQRDINESCDIAAQTKSAENGEKGYRRTREKPSQESINKAREIEILSCGVHPIFGTELAAQQSILDKMASLKPKMTIFEIRQKKCKNVTSEAVNAANIMRNMRELNCDRIEQFKAKRAEKISNMLDVVESVKADSFIPYRPSDDSEKHLEINAFQKEASAAMIDSSNQQQNTKGKKVWDRKRKKFVSNQVEQDKRIKTESGNWIKQSFKTGKYDDYKKKKNTDFADSDNEDNTESGEMSSSRLNKERLNTIFNARRRGGAAGRGGREQGALRKPENILKARSDRAKLEARGKGRGRGGPGRGSSMSRGGGSRGRGGSFGGGSRGRGGSGGRGRGGGGGRGRGGSGGRGRDSRGR